ncbi:CAP domain-containing protein [Bacillus taeanensis]|uniref:SCP domain-containing protein n=1 Tax=Bacillus taeanensis TaxID=273032 RepID=A0A366XW00_9BACI|nr:CAP domain-containing protein [Bacillus taeanensis]RBW68314.1 hypothetical protein DS031_17495 [Bacillus taeanensis]
MNKLLITSLLSASLFSMGGQAHAEDMNQTQLTHSFENMKTEVKTFHNFEDLENYLNKIFGENIQINSTEIKKHQTVKDKPATQQPTQQVQAPQQENKTTKEQTSNALSQAEQQMVNLVNEERQKQGLHPLKVNTKLTEVARVKAKDMIENNYFSHQSPTYGSPFEMMKQFGISYRTAGENLAGNQTVESAHQGLMNSDGHRANILNENYTEIGIGIVEGGPYGKMFVQLFKG